ncbi:MAG: GntR family transcriptional regulator [Gemmatimonadota bacterium]
MRILVHPADDLPIYRQIMRQIMDAIAGGRLAPGERLASHRELSEQLVIAPLTVKKAYDELEALGYIESQRGRGTFVADRLPRDAGAAQTAALQDAARALLSQAYLAGLRLPDVVALLKDADRELTNGPVPRHRKAE